MSRFKRERTTTFPKISDEDLKDRVYINEPTFFDIETGPMDADDLEQFVPDFEAPKNIKDEEKINKAIDAKRIAWLDKAALSPLTGQIIAIGLLRDGKYTILEGRESDIINDFWTYWRNYDPQPFIGFNIRKFDLPYIIRRGFHCGVDYPRNILQQNRYWRDNIIDLMDTWACGIFNETISLDNFCKFLKIKGKSGNGKHFSELYKTNPEAAIDYLKNDLKITERVWEKTCG
jgi:DNA polymerase elongation subunit (family B)|tara:strand:- start:3783 stop:4478 length:696 start_codon:yes stop_codon:yes gene_type:complete